METMTSNIASAAAKATLLAIVSIAFAAGAADAQFTRAGSGEPARIEQWRGQWLVVNYWAEWCAPCRAEIPELNELHAAHEHVTVVGVNFDGIDGYELEALIERMKIAFPVITPDPHEVLGFRRPNVLPTTFLVDPEGRVTGRLQGPHNREDFEQAIGF